MRRYAEESENGGARCRARHDGGGAVRANSKPECFANAFSGRSRARSEVLDAFQLLQAANHGNLRRHRVSGKLVFQSVTPTSPT